MDDTVNYLKLKVEQLKQKKPYKRHFALTIDQLSHIPQENLVELLNYCRFCGELYVQDMPYEEIVLKYIEILYLFGSIKSNFNQVVGFLSKSIWGGAKSKITTYTNINFELCPKEMLISTFEITLIILGKTKILFETQKVSQKGEEARLISVLNDTLLKKCKLLIKSSLTKFIDLSISI